MSTVTDKFFKQLRQHVKDKHSSTRIHQFLNTVYEAGYRQGLLDAAAKLNAVADQENMNRFVNNTVTLPEGDHDNQGASDGHDSDRVSGQSDSTEPTASLGTNAADGDSDQGSASAAQSE